MDQVNDQVYTIYDGSSKQRRIYSLAMGFKRSLEWVEDTWIFSYGWEFKTISDKNLSYLYEEQTRWTLNPVLLFFAESFDINTPNYKSFWKVEEVCPTLLA